MSSSTRPSTKPSPAISTRKEEPTPSWRRSHEPTCSYKLEVEERGGGKGGGEGRDGEMGDVLLGLEGRLVGLEEMGFRVSLVEKALAPRVAFPSSNRKAHRERQVLNIHEMAVHWYHFEIPFGVCMSFALLAAAVGSLLLSSTFRR